MKHMLHTMHKLISVSYRKGLLVALIGGAISLWLAQSSSAMEVANKQQPNQLLYDTEQSKLIVNGEALQLDQAPAIVGEKLYMPLKFLSQFFRLELSFDATNSKVAATGKDFKLVFNMKDQSLELNDEMLDQRNLAFMSNERVMIQLAWLSERLGGSYEEQQDGHRIIVNYTPEVDNTYIAKPNAKPIAKFVVDKASYAMGEKITYTNLSYDPDSDGIALTWEGKQDAFFTPGEHQVSLVAIDQNGNRSEPYSRTILVTEESVYSELDFNIAHQQAGLMFAASDSMFNATLLELPEVKKKQRAGERRKLLVSDSPETIVEQGILYEDVINGSARLYANHLNGSENELELIIYASNHTSKPIKLTTERRGQSAPSQFAMLVGSEAVVDFLTDNTKDDVSEQPIFVQPGETVEYYRFESLSPQYGINGIFDVESDGELLITFAALIRQEAVESKRSDARMQSDEPQSQKQLPKLSYNGHVRGSFQQASIVYDVYPSKRNKHAVQRLMIADGVQDPFLQGFDAQRNQQASLSGNYGVVYHINIHHPRKMALLLMARGGTFKGMVKINDQFLRVPSSGMLEPMKSFVSLGQFDGTEKLVQLQFIAPAGSSLPIMLLFYPLK